MSNNISRYQARGVSATKDEVHTAIKNLDSGLFPYSFCKVTKDYLTGNPYLCNIVHADGSGSKSIIAYLHYCETGDASVFRGIAQDSIVMNVDDLACVGAVKNIVSSSTINRNARRIGSDILSEIINGTDSFLNQLRTQGVEVYSGGGETADVGDLTPTLIVDNCMSVIMDKDHVVAANGIYPGLAIVGLSSTGQASYEDHENSGIGSNGLTSARHDLLSSYYRDYYPETFDAQISEDLIYTGPYKLSDKLPDTNFSIGEALLSPTRSYAPVVAALLAANRRAIKGIIHCSGGGQTKCLRFGRQVNFIKYKMFPIPPIFQTIQRVSKTSWQEMYQVYNMGHRFEIYCEPGNVNMVISAARDYGIDAQAIGFTEPSNDAKNHLTILHGREHLYYSL